MITPGPEQVKVAVEYTLRVLLNCTDEEWLKLKNAIAYNDSAPIDQPSIRILISPGTLFTLGVYGTMESLPVIPLKEIQGVPLLYGNAEVRQENGILFTKADIVASAYFLLTRYEELVSNERDQFGRFPGKKSLPYRACFLHRPIVEEYGVILRHWLREVGLPIPVQISRFKISLTHDLDIPRYYKRFRSALKVIFKAVLGKAPAGQALTALGSRLGLCKDPFDTFETMAFLAKQLAERRGDVQVQTIYFVMAGGSSQYDRHYSLNDAYVKRTLRNIQQHDIEIGLHASFESGDKPDLIESEKNHLEKAISRRIVKNRHHYLHFKEPRDIWALVKAGITDDYTMGYADCAGFRLGVCRPVPCFDGEKMIPIPIMEHPLIVMDATLSGATYMNLSPEAALTHCLQLASQVEKFNGELVLLWHNHFLGGSPGVFHMPVYKSLLNGLANNDQTF